MRYTSYTYESKAEVTGPRFRLDCHDSSLQYAFSSHNRWLLSNL